MPKYIVTEDNVLLGRSYLTKNEVIDVTEEEAEAIGDGIRELTDAHLAQMDADEKAITDKADLATLIKDLSTQLVNAKHNLQISKEAAGRYADVVTEKSVTITAIEKDLADAIKAFETDNTEDDQAALDKAAEKQRLADEDAKAAEAEKQRLASLKEAVDEASEEILENTIVSSDKADAVVEVETPVEAAPAMTKKKRGLFGRKQN